MTHICKEDSYSRSTSLVPNFATRWHSFCNNSSLQKSTTKYNKQNNNNIKKYPVTPKKKIPNYKKIPVRSN